MKYLELKYVKHLALGVLTVVVLGAGAFVTKVSAQNAGVFEIQVPFDFVLMGRTYPAAKYRIGRLDLANPDTLVLKSSNDKTLLIFLTQRLNSGAAEYSRLTFRRYGETNFLDTVRASGESYESRVPTAKSDRRRRSTIAQASQIVSLNVK